MRRALFLLLTGCLCALSAPAQTPPDAGALRQQIEQGREPTLPQPLQAAKPAEPAALAPTNGLLITVTAFRLIGNTLIETDQLQAALREFLNRPLDYNQLQYAAAVVAEVYRSAGWVVRAYLPEQDIEGGVVSIQIVEAVFGGIRIDGAAPKRISLAHIEAIFSAHQATGEVLNADALDRAMLLADDLPGVAVAGSLREGALDGQSELLLRLSDEPLLTGNVLLDNTGNRSTGPVRLTADLHINSPFQLGELLSATAMHAEGSDYLRVGATLPAGLDGWRVGANASSMNYHLVLAEFAALNSRGSSDSAGLEASYPLIRSRLHSLYLNANADHKSFDNQANGGTSSHYASNSLSLGLWGNLFDNLGGGGANNASLSLIAGQLDLGGSPNQALDAAGTRAEGDFNLLRYSISRQQVLDQNLSLYAALSGQSSDRNLDSSEKFYLGGANGVRAYPANEGGGASGQLFNLELRWRLPQGLTLSGFYDIGQISVNHSSGFTGAAAPNNYQLQGNGLSLSWQTSTGLVLKCTWAQRIGNHPAPSPNGNDQDGSRLLDRWWLTADLPF